jgi:hypothetical protein
VDEEAIDGPDPRTPEEFARDKRVPLEAVLEALDDVAQYRPRFDQERDREVRRTASRAPKHIRFFDLCSQHLAGPVTGQSQSRLPSMSQVRPAAVPDGMGFCRRIKMK